MARYVAFLRGVSPMNCRMPALQKAFEAAGFTAVRTLLSSGNVAFDVEPVIVPTLEARAEAAMVQHLGRVFVTIVRPSAYLQDLIASSPFDEFTLPPGAKRVITFLRRPTTRVINLPITHDRTSILKLLHTEVLAAHVPDDQPASFLRLLERTFGADITTRTLDTVRKCAAA